MIKWWHYSAADNFNQILREINFRDFTTFKIVILTILHAQNFDFVNIFAFWQGWKAPNSKFRALDKVKNGRFLKAPNLQKLISRKISLNFNTVYIPLCFRNFQNVKLRQHGLGILQFACHTDFTWNQILVDSISPKMSFLAISEILKFGFLVDFALESCSN